LKSKEDHPTMCIQLHSCDLDLDPMTWIFHLHLDVTGTQKLSKVKSLNRAHKSTFYPLTFSWWPSHMNVTYILYILKTWPHIKTKLLGQDFQEWESNRHTDIHNQMHCNTTSTCGKTIS